MSRLAASRRFGLVGAGLPIFLSLVAMISGQTGVVIAKTLLPQTGATGMGALRLSIAALILCAIRRSWRQKLGPAEPGRIVAYGWAMGAMNLFFYLSLRGLPIGVAVALEFTGPLGVALMASRRPVDFVWVTLAVIGLLLLARPWEPQGAIDHTSAGFGLAAGLCWGLYIVFGKRVSALDSGVASSLGMVAGTVLVLPIGIIANGQRLLNLSVLPAAAAVAVLSSALPYSCEIVALKRLNARTFGILMSLQPGLAALVALGMLNEHLRLIQWGSLSCIIAASLGTMLKPDPYVGPETIA